MAVGLRVVNDNNVVQLDDSYRNYVLVQKGTGATSSEQAPSFELNIQSDEQLVVAVRAASGAVIVANGKRNGSWQYLVTSRTPQETVYWYAFGKNYPTPTDTFGLRIFNENGTLMYHSALKPLSIVGSIRKSLPIANSSISTTPVANLPETPAWVPESQNYPIKSGRTYAALSLTTNAVTVRYKVNKSGNWWAAADIYVYFPVNTGNGLNLEAVRFIYSEGDQNPTFKGQYGWSSVRRQYNELFYWIIDVTGL